MMRLSADVRIEYRGVGKRFSGHQGSASDKGAIVAVQDVDLSVHDGEIVSLIGPSGCGKSTLLNMGAGLYLPSSGGVFVDGEKVDAPNPHVGFMLQKDLLLPWRTIRRNVEFGLEIQGIAAAERRDRAIGLLENCRLGGFENHYPAQLSGGMQQRVGLARALTTDAEILLMDEAFSALDPLIRTDMQEILLGLQSELNKTIVFITHDLDEALRIGDDITILRDGEIIQQGSPQDIVMRPSNDYIADFIKDVNRSRVLLVRSIMEPTESENGPKIDMNIPLEEALSQLSSKQAMEGSVIDSEGKVVGKLDLSAAIEAIRRPERSSNDLQYR